MVERNNPTHCGGVLTFFTSPAVVVSFLLAILGAYLWKEHNDEALVAFLWVPIFLTWLGDAFFLPWAPTQQFSLRRRG